MIRNYADLTKSLCVEPMSDMNLRFHGTRQPLNEEQLAAARQVLGEAYMSQGWQTGDTFTQDWGQEGDYGVVLEEAIRTKSRKEEIVRVEPIAAAICRRTSTLGIEAGQEDDLVAAVAVVPHRRGSRLGRMTLSRALWLAQDGGERAAHLIVPTEENPHLHNQLIMSAIGARPVEDSDRGIRWEIPLTETDRQALQAA